MGRGVFGCVLEGGSLERNEIWGEGRRRKAERGEIGVRVYLRGKFIVSIYVFLVQVEFGRFFLIRRI